MNKKKHFVLSLIMQLHLVMKNCICILGGMGGTRKSQVIKAVVAFFDARHENHWFIVVAPTGSAAALINGATYHSVLGINDGN